MEWSRTTFVGLAATLVLVTACAGDGRVMIDPLVVESVVQQVDEAEVSEACPVDLGSAVSAAGIEGVITDEAVSVDDHESDGALASVRPAASIACYADVETDVHADVDVTVSLVALTAPDVAVFLVDPLAISFEELYDLQERVQEEPLGVVVHPADGGAALVRLPVRGGDGALLVGVDPVDAVTADGLNALVRNVVEQVRRWRS